MRGITDFVRAYHLKALGLMKGRGDIRVEIYLDQEQRNVGQADLIEQIRTAISGEESRISRVTFSLRILKSLSCTETMASTVFTTAIC